MHRLLRGHHSVHLKLTRTLGVLLGIAGISLFCLGTLVYAGVQTKLYVRSLQSFDLSGAQLHAQKALPIAQVLSTITFHSSPDIEAWQEALTLPAVVQPLMDQARQASQSVSDSGSSFSFEQALPILQKLSDKLDRLQNDIKHSFLVIHVITKPQQLQLAQGIASLKDLESFVSTVSVGKQTWLVLFQNSDELRATGGFSGSYALVTLNNGRPEEIVVEDIYDADGQFKGYIDPPPGVKEYTSSNQGLRLPDANWNPDFSESAQTILQFFALGNKRNITGIVAVNLEVGESLLKTTGPLWLPDYNQSISAENLHSELREDRDEFFPGSIQKKHILSQTFTVLRQKIGELPPADQLKIMEVLYHHSQNKDIQAFSISPDLQAIFTRYGITGQVGMNNHVLTLGQPWCQSQASQESCTFTPTIFFPVESNVGINKANQYISRTVKIENTLDKELIVTMHFTNSGPLTNKTLLSQTVTGLTNPKLKIAENGYANYQRVLISSVYKLSSVSVDGKTISGIDQNAITSTDGQKLTQYGFLATVVPESQQDIILHFSVTDPSFQLTEHPLLIQKQAGLPPTSYTVITPQNTQQFSLNTDTLLSWK